MRQLLPYAALALALFAGACSGHKGYAPNSNRYEAAWRQTAEMLGKADKVDKLRMPDVEFGSLSYVRKNCRERMEAGACYNHFTDTVYFSDLWFLHHELAHAVLFKTEGLAAMWDHDRIAKKLGEGPMPVSSYPAFNRPF